jgi:NADH-quinone oxidoreductase subunit E
VRAERELADILSRYPNKHGGVHPCAAPVPGAERLGQRRGHRLRGRRLELSTAHVKGVVTFYTLFNQKPVGKHQVWVCRTLSCALGAPTHAAPLREALGIHAGETTKDGKVTLRTAECLASCGTAPMMQVDKDYHENLTRPRSTRSSSRSSLEVRGPDRCSIRAPTTSASATTDPNGHTLAAYERDGGYQQAKRALGMSATICSTR